MTIRLSSKLKNIIQVETFAYGLKQKYHINDEVFPKILISVTEAVNNAIIHGNQVDESKQVMLYSKLHNRELHILVEDEGHGFEPNNIPDPCTEENIFKCGGRGVMIMKSLTDEVHFKKNGSCVELVFNI